MCARIKYKASDGTIADAHISDFANLIFPGIPFQGFMREESFDYTWRSRVILRQVHPIEAFAERIRNAATPTKSLYYREVQNSGIVLFVVQGFEFPKESRVLTTQADPELVKHTGHDRMPLLVPLSA